MIRATIAVGSSNMDIAYRVIGLRPFHTHSAKARPSWRQPGKSPAGYGLALALVGMVTHFELQNITTISKKEHTWHCGKRMRGHLFGQANTMADATNGVFSEAANNRRLELQMRFSF